MVYESVGEFVLKSADLIFIKCTDFQGNYPGTPSISDMIIKEILFMFTKFI